MKTFTAIALGAALLVTAPAVASDYGAFQFEVWRLREQVNEQQKVLDTIERDRTWDLITKTVIGQYKPAPNLEPSFDIEGIVKRQKEDKERARAR